MFRVIHSQTKNGTISLGDVEDGVRFASNVILDAAKRKILKQKVIIPYANPNDTTQPGYTDLIESDQVLLSANHGNIHGLVDAGMVTVQIYTPSDLATPVVTATNLTTPGSGALAITGTKFLSLPPDTSVVVATGTSSFSLTRTQITTAGGSFTDTSISIPVALLTSFLTGTRSVAVVADRNASNVCNLPVITVADLGTPGAGDVTITGTQLLTTPTTGLSAVFTGTGAVTLTYAQVIAGTGTWSATSIFVPAALVPTVAATTTSVRVVAGINIGNTLALA
jgi:hypothetical protein